MAFFQTENLWLNQLADGVAVLVLDVPDRKVNVLNQEVLADLDRALDRAGAEASFQLLIIRSGKSGSFCAGADLHAFTSGMSADEAGALSQQGQQVFEKLAGLRLPTVAIIAGSCLGGGLELALACDYRVAVSRPDTRFGFPEIELGLIPGWGGTQRLPRAVGLERALQIILAGKRLDAREALQWGLVDEVSRSAEDEPPAFLGEVHKRTRAGLPYLTWRQKLLESSAPGRWLLFRGARRLLERRVPDDMPAPWEALEAIRIGLKDSAAGLAFERDAIGRLADTAACRNLVRIFHMREQARQPAPGNNARPIRRVGIVGAGTMGAGIAQLAVLHGCEVVVREAGEMALGFAMLRIMGLLQKAVDRGLLAGNELADKLAAIHGTTAWKGFDDLDLVIEAIDEDLGHKQTLFRQAENHIARDTILASNTSSLRIADMQEGLERPERLAGLHFFNPVHQMPLVEVVRGPASHDRVLEALRQWAISLGKTPIIVKDSPGFVVNRVLMPYLNEAVRLVSEDVPVERVDTAMRRFGMPMGPLEVLDQVGLDVAAHIARAVGPVFGERFELQPGFALMAEQRWLGQKTGAGFYRYRGRRKHVNRQAVLALTAASASTGEAVRGLEADTASEQMAAIRERLVGLMVNEAARCLDEGLAGSADAIDLALVLGAGWAPHRGGPLRFVRDSGPSAMAETLSRLAQQLGGRYEPCGALARLGG
jgi:3-hydroxyacyl-CoA dehydrogenase/enoyl-CoA hydratase/3-hydroxybutyryl-CoA epimerase